MTMRVRRGRDGRRHGHPNQTSASTLSRTSSGPTPTLRVYHWTTEEITTPDLLSLREQEQPKLGRSTMCNCSSFKLYGQYSCSVSDNQNFAVQNYIFLVGTCLYMFNGYKALGTITCLPKNLMCLPKVRIWRN